MRYWVSAVLFIMLASGCERASTGLTDAQRDAITSQVNEVVAGLFDAMNAHDADRVLSHYVESGDLAYVGALRIGVGREGFAAMVGSYYERHPDVTFTHSIVHTQVLSPAAAVVFSEGGSSDTEFLVWTHVLVRQDDGTWRIAYEHEAWPGAEVPSRHPGM